MNTRIIGPLCRTFEPLRRCGTALVSSAALFLLVMVFTLAQFRATKRRAQS
jgi:hypothetical protein